MFFTSALGGENLCNVRQTLLAVRHNNYGLPERKSSFINYLGEVQRSYRT